jgi:hypothetical protein
MAPNPYESPQAPSEPVARFSIERTTDWFALVGLLGGSIAAVEVGIAINWFHRHDLLGDFWFVWLLLGTCTAVACIAIAGWLCGRLLHCHG